jgi:hypothetical protein
MQTITIKAMKVSVSIGLDDKPMLMGGHYMVDFGGFMTPEDYEALRKSLNEHITVIVDDKRKPI